jgi:multicomponent Na+:H+ antiporter subunit A
MARTFTALGAGPDRGFDVFIEMLVKVSFHVTRLIQPGRLEFYVTATFAVIAAVLLVPLFLYGELPSMPSWPRDMPVHELTFIAIAVAGLVAVLTASSRLTAIIALGIQGFAVAVIFLLFGAPDLSFTQFMVETLSVVILTLVMTRLRLSPSDHRGLGQKLLDSTIAIACGTGFALFLMRATQASFDNRLTDFYNTYSKVIAHGANVVNVIIVDFRGTDTLGEIAVVMITGLAILALIRIRPAAALKGPAKTAKKKGARA